MSDRLFGVETEYAVTGLKGPGAAIDRGHVVELLQEAAARALASAADLHSGGVFLQNGSRFYIDAGLHPELATPECTDPGELVRYVRAGDRILERVADRASSQLPAGTRIEVFRCNVDYSGSGATWGCHESYLHRAAPAALATHIIPHLATRIVFTGAGGFNPFAPGLELTLSPRVHHLTGAVSEHSTSCRGIYHTKNEPLCAGGYGRLHVLCGESCSSELATWLKIGTTALVVALIEAGHAPGDGVQLRSPVGAMRTAAGDPACRETVLLESGRSMHAIDVQRHYLAQVEAQLGSDVMPGWAEDVCRTWRATLDRLQDNPQSMARELDWAIKRRLYEQHAHGRGLTWESIAHWNDVLATLQKALQANDVSVPLRTDALLAWKSPARRHVQALAPLLHERGLSLDELPAFLRLRQELFELDTRFAQLGDKGIFTALDEAGALAHHLPGVDGIEQAVLEPPASGRAALRGTVIRRANGDGRYMCAWDHVWDFEGCRFLDLSDPFETAERWEDLGVPAGSGDPLGMLEARRQAMRVVFPGRRRPAGEPGRE